MRSGAHVGEDRAGGGRHVHGGGQEGGGGGVGGVVGGGRGGGGGEHRELRLLHPPKQGVLRIITQAKHLYQIHVLVQCTLTTG